MARRAVALMITVVAVLLWVVPAAAQVTGYQPPDVKPTVFETEFPSEAPASEPADETVTVTLPPPAAPSLPATGMAVASSIVAVAVLLAAGTALLVVGRRRDAER